MSKIIAKMGVSVINEEGDDNFLVKQKKILPDPGHTKIEANLKRKFKESKAIKKGISPIEKMDFEKRLMRRRDLIFPEYDFAKLWRDA